MNANISKALRNLVFERDSYTCVLCDNPANDAHHYLPRSLGGRNIPSNIVSLCRKCHMVIHRELWSPSEDLDEMDYRIAEYLGDFYAEEIEAEQKAFRELQRRIADE